MIYVLVGGGALNAVSVPHLVRARLDPAGVSPEGCGCWACRRAAWVAGMAASYGPAFAVGGRGGVAAAARAARR
ncbi:hypothetical protein GCM10020256_23720 [Streptomyces thermocoprophilus]